MNSPICITPSRSALVLGALLLAACAGDKPDPARPINPALPAADAGAPPQQESPPPRRRERFQPQQTHEQPEFLRRPVRRARNEEETPDSTGNGNAKEEPSRE